MRIVVVVAFVVLNNVTLFLLSNFVFLIFIKNNNFDDDIFCVQNFLNRSYHVVVKKRIEIKYFETRNYIEFERKFVFERKFLKFAFRFKFEFNNTSI